MPYALTSGLAENKCLVVMEGLPVVSITQPVGKQARRDAGLLKNQPLVAFS